jgi:hypothetical protein
MDLTLLPQRAPTTVAARPSRRAHPARRALGTVALAGAGLIGALAAAPAASAATDAPAAPAAAVAAVAVAQTDGCTAVPDRPLGFDFKGACDAHDICYENKPYGDSWSGRLACDDDFFDNMAAHCKDNHAWWSPLRAACLAAASVYYDGVRKFGWAFF